MPPAQLFVLPTRMEIRADTNRESTRHLPRSGREMEEDRVLGGSRVAIGKTMNCEHYNRINGSYFARLNVLRIQANGLAHSPCIRTTMPASDSRSRATFIFKPRSQITLGDALS